MKALQINEEKIIREGVDRIIPRDEFKGKDGTTWYLIPRDTKLWPNGNPHMMFYTSVWGRKLIIRLNEIGGLIFAKYA